MTGPLPSNGGTEHVERAQQRAAGEVDAARAGGAASDGARSCQAARSTAAAPAGAARRARRAPRCAAISVSISASVLAAVSWTRKPTSSLGTSG